MLKRNGFKWLKKYKGKYLAKFKAINTMLLTNARTSLNSKELVIR